MSVNIFPNNIYWKVMFCMVDFPQNKVLFKKYLDGADVSNSPPGSRKAGNGGC